MAYVLIAYKSYHERSVELVTWCLYNVSLAHRSTVAMDTDIEKFDHACRVHFNLENISNLLAHQCFPS